MRAIRTARLRSKSSHPTSEPGMCLRECYVAPAAAADAAQAWFAAKHKHPKSPRVDEAEFIRSIPRGVPIFWTGGSGGHGHVAIATGFGKCWSTDIRRPGYFDKVPVEEITARWGLQLAGWTEDLNGVRVWSSKEGTA